MMRLRPHPAAWLALLAAGAALARSPAPSAQPGAALPDRPAPAPPGLILFISVDQLSSNLYAEWRPRYRAGLARLSGGILYPGAYHTHALTDTCPGHSVLLSGRHPRHTGIVNNQMPDVDGRVSYCVSDPGVRLAHDSEAPPVGPARLEAATLGDWLKTRDTRSRVFAVSTKDRAAITLGGHRADGIYWLAPGFGFTTFIAPGADAGAALAPLAAVNERNRALWGRAPAWNYTHPECRQAEASWTFSPELTWHSQLPPSGWDPTTDRKEIAARLLTSPRADELTGEAAVELIRRFDLGHGPAPDLLAVSFSGTDYVGHRFGTRGPEMCEQMLQLDATIGRLLAELDHRHVRYVVALSADHGGSDFPERLAQRGYPEARRVPDAQLLGRVNTQLMHELGLERAPLSGEIDAQTLHLDVSATDRARVAAAAVRVLRAQPEVAGAWTREELLALPLPKNIPPEEATLEQRYALSVYPGRSPDLLVALQPLDFPLPVPSRPGHDYLATHGSAWDYDRRVPLLLWWPGARSELRYLPVSTTRIAPTLAALAGLDPPADLDGVALPLE